MIDGLEDDDKYRMVEDEFVATAGTFTAHLHAAEYQRQLNVVPVRLGRHGILKQIFLGVRESDVEIDYIAAFTQLAKSRRKPRRASR